MMEAIEKGHEENKKIVKFINEIVEQIGKPKFEFESQIPDEKLFEEIKDFAIEKIRYALDTNDKTVREARLNQLRTKFMRNSMNYIQRILR